MTYEREMQNWKVVYLEVVPSDTAALIASCLPPGFQLSFIKDYSDEEIMRILPHVDFALVATHPLPANLIAYGKKLRLIQHQGVGFDKTDVKAARSNGISVALCPEGTTIGVAEHTFLLILALYKRLLLASSSLHAGEWRQFSLRAGSFEIAGKTLGLVGLGRIGKAVATRAIAFDAKPIYYDLVRYPEEENQLGINYCSFDDLLYQSDIVSLHIPSNPETRHIINSKTLTKMRKGSILINTSRGTLVDQKDLVEVLASGHLLGAGLDVFEKEPLGADDPLLKLPNVVLTPHIAAGTQDALIAKMKACFNNMLLVTKGFKPLHLAN